MAVDPIARIASNPKYQELRTKRSRFGWWLTLAMLVVYYGFILLVAFDKQLLATRIGDGVMTLGMPIGLAQVGARGEGHAGADQCRQRQREFGGRFHFSTALVMSSDSLSNSLFARRT